MKLNREFLRSSRCSGAGGEASFAGWKLSTLCWTIDLEAATGVVREQSELTSILTSMSVAN